MHWPLLMIVGDSHGCDLLSGLLQARSPVNARVLRIQWICEPVLGPRPYGDGTPIKTREIAESCRQEGLKLKNNPQLEAADTILIASTWQDYGLDALPRTIEYMKRHYHGRIVLVSGRYYFADPSALLTSVSTVEEANARFDASKWAKRGQEEFDRLAAIAADAGVDLLDLRPYACDPTGSGRYCPLFEDGNPLYQDFHHWSRAGARRVGLRLRAGGRLPFLF